MFDATFWVIILAFLAAGIVLTVRAFRRLRRWYRQKRPALRHFLPNLFLPLAIVLLTPILMAAQLPGLYPAAEAALETASGTVEQYIAERYQPDRSSEWRCDVTGFYLDGADIPFQLFGRSFPAETFVWEVAGQTVTAGYVPAGGEGQVYAMAIGEESLFRYAGTVGARWERVWGGLLLMAVFLVFGLWLTLDAVRLFCDPSQDTGTGRTSQLLGVRLGLCCFVMFPVLMVLQGRDRGAVYPAYTQVALSTQAAVRLPGAWEAQEAEGMVWYSDRGDVSLSLHWDDLGTPAERGETDEAWLEASFAALEAFLLETCLRTPDRPGRVLADTWSVELPGGYPATAAWGRARASAGSRNWFLAVAIPDLGCTITFQASTRTLDWEALSAYGEAELLSLLDCLVLEA